MLLEKLLQRFLDRSPITVMVRATLENLLRPAKLNAIFQEVAEVQYTRNVLFSSVIELMSLVVGKIRPSIRSAYAARAEEIDGSLTAVYEKLNHLEPKVMSAMVQRTAADAARIIDELGTAEPAWVPGLNVRVLDGNKLTGTEHRLDVLRTTKQAALPGQSLAVLDPSRRLVVDVVPCEDAHAQERSLLDAVLERVAENDLWLADRNFCTAKFLLGIAHRLGYFIIREHGQCFGYRLLGKVRPLGRGATGEVSEQTIEVNFQGKPWRLRRVSVALDEPTQDGDTHIHVLTNLPVAKADGVVVAECYRRRWSIEGVFQILTDSLRCEINTLGYPKAALFGFSTALLAFNALSVAQEALRAAHGEAASAEKISEQRLVMEVAAVHEGLDIATPAAAWEPVQTMPPRQFADQLVTWARKVKLQGFKKHKRGPKKPKPKRKSGDGNTHVSTARLLAEKNHAQATQSP
jgi:hypothetical protein